MKNILYWGLLIVLSLGCRSDEKIPAGGKLVVDFIHSVEGSHADYDQMIYENEAGNIYELTNIQWFISDMALKKKDGSEFYIEGEDWNHYIDSDLPETWTWHLIQGIDPGDYSSVRFTIGNVENWFRSPHVYDHNVYGSRIMNSQEAMGKIRDNGIDVFSITIANEEI
ncbi:MAG: hypothetical protein KFF73_01380 [Cyclobacteriaceae bacterium]|nr:hypothetical protein [Cyclobacteriaceae bacterium]